MLDRLPESAPRRQWPMLPASLAVAVHAVIVLGVVELRAEPEPRVRTPVARPIEPYRIILDAPRPAASAETGASGTAAAALPARPGRVPLPRLSGVDLPTAAPIAIAGAPAPRGRTLVGLFLPPVPGGAGGVATGSEAGVEAPELLPGTLGALGDEARRLGLEGTVSLRCIVDTSGRVEPESIEVVSQGEPGLVVAAVRALASARFRPGRQGGMVVRVLVVQRFRFSVTGPR